MPKSKDKMNDSFLNENEYIFKKYKPIKKIGGGNFGNIYSTIRLKDKNVFAMKTEKRNIITNTLESEAYYLYILQGFGIPKLITYGHTKKYNILIETLLDKSLHNIYFKNRKICNIADACLIGIQILDRLEWIHSKNLIYRDVKPENFLIGINDPNVIYVVDFGLCKKYRSSKTGKHILPRLTGRFMGTLLYASSNAFRGKESSRRDDLISLGYMLIYLFKRKLPWKYEFNKLNKTKYFEIVYLKDTDGNGELFKKVPQEIIEYVKYTKNLKFEQDPDYSYLRSLFIKILNNMNLNYKSLSFSWIKSKNNKLSCLPRNNSVRKSSPHIRIIKKIREERKKRLKTESINKLGDDLKNLSIESRTNSFLEQENVAHTCRNHKINNITLSNKSLSPKKHFKIIEKKNIPTNKTVEKINYNIGNNKLIINKKNELVSNILKLNKYLINSHDNSLILTDNSQDKKSDNNNNIIIQKKTNPILFRNKKLNNININKVIRADNSFSNKGKKTKIYKKNIPLYSNRIIDLNNISNDINYVSNIINYNNEKTKNIGNITKENINLMNNIKKNTMKDINTINIKNISLINNNIQYLKTEYNITPNSEYLKSQNKYFI